jgi:hypothetical protein
MAPHRPVQDVGSQALHWLSTHREPDAQLEPQVKVLLHASTAKPHEFVAPQISLFVTHVLVAGEHT